MKLKNIVAGIAASAGLAGLSVAQPLGMGPGMMNGYGMGQGMMGGGYGTGPGMMFGYTNEAYAGLDLTPDQQKSIAGIQEQTSRSMWQLMGTMHGQGYHMQGIFWPGALDEAAARKSFQTMAETQKAMFELQLNARKKIDAWLTGEQREKLSHHWGSR